MNKESQQVAFSDGVMSALLNGWSYILTLNSCPKEWEGKEATIKVVPTSRGGAIVVKPMDTK